jgi:hypothetical protein
MVNRRTEASVNAQKLSRSMVGLLRSVLRDTIMRGCTNGNCSGRTH